MLFARANGGPSCPRKKQSGQALIEYMMVLLFTLIICGGAFYQFNDAFRQFLSGYFGQYLSCLLEAGELPSLGYDGQNQPDICNSEFQPFSLAKGRPLIKDPGVGTPPKEIGGVPPAENMVMGGRPIKERGGVAPGNVEAAGSGPVAERSYGGNIPGDAATAGGGGGAGGQFASFGPRSSQNIPLSGADAGAKKSGQRGMEDETISSRELFDDGQSGRRKEIPLAKNERKPTERVKQDVPADAKEATPSRTITVEKPEKKIEVQEEGLTFSDFIKYLLIAAVLLAMLVFFGGQILQISKSGEK
ncbi:MAG: hypothetical protein AB7F59_06030 [Bdellovibrionales bacterium]